MSPFDEDTRTRLLEEFRGYLENTDLDAETSAEISAADEPEVDLFTLLTEMAALKNEVRLESRQVKNTLDELRKFSDELNTHTSRIERELERVREDAAQAERRIERGMLLDLADLRDRLQNGVDAANRPAPLLSHLLPGSNRYAASLAEGQRLTLQRLDDLLGRYEVRALAVIGKALDPQCMRVVGVENRSDIASGTVLRETRRGFYHRGEVLRIAEVIVNKKENQE